MQDIIAAADVCDTSTNFDVGGSTVTLPRYRCGIVIPSDADHNQAMDSILATMAGRSGWAGGRWTLRAGAMAAPVLAIDTDWLVTDDAAGDEPVVSASNAIAREQRVNRVTGSCIDPAQRYQMLPFPIVGDAALIAAKGERPREMQLDGCSHIAHAQHLGKIAIREAQAGLRLELSCDVRAIVAELFDVATITLPDYGMAAKTAEVTGWQWSPNGGVTLRMAEITGAIFDPSEPLDGRDPAPDSGMRPPWDIDTLTGLAVTSGVGALTDGSVVTRTVVTWTTATDARILQGGRVEVQYAQVHGMPVSRDWPQQREMGSADRAVVIGLLGGRYYAFRARFVQTLPEVRGAWSAVVIHQVAGPPLLGTDGVAPGAMTEVYVDTPSSAVTVTGTQTTPDGYASVRNTVVATVSFTPAADGTAQLYFDGRGTYANSTAVLAGARWSIQHDGGTFDGWRRVEIGVAPSATITFPMQTTRRFNVLGSVTYSFSVYAAKLNPGDTFTVDQMELRAEVVKR